MDEKLEALYFYRVIKEALKRGEVKEVVCTLDKDGDLCVNLDIKIGRLHDMADD